MGYHTFQMTGIYPAAKEKSNLWIYPDDNAITAALEGNGLGILKMESCYLIELGAVCRRAAQRG